MNQKTKTINLIQILAKEAMKPGEYDYRVIKCTNSTEPRVGDIITKTQVDEYCRLKDWTVNIT